MNYTTDIFLKDLLNKFNWDHEVGVVASDELRRFNICQNFSVISNLSRRSEEGTHFVAFILREKTLLYLDPLNIYVELNKDINDFLSWHQQRGVQVCKLSHAIQSLYSNYCGFFSLFFCLLFNKSLENSRAKYSKFQKNELIKNDCIVLHNIATAINENLS